MANHYEVVLAKTYYGRTKRFVVTGSIEVQGQQVTGAGESGLLQIEDGSLGLALTGAKALEVMPPAQLGQGGLDSLQVQRPENAPGAGAERAAHGRQ